MSRVDFSISARQDLTGIFDYIAADRPRAAVQLVEDIEDRCRILADHPLAAEAHPEFGADDCARVAQFGPAILSCTDP